MSNTLVLAVIAAYFVILLAVGAISSASAKGKSGNSTFFTGDRQSRWWMVAIAMIGTSISGVSFISVPGMVAASQFSYLQMALGFIAGYIVIAYVLLPLYYKLEIVSIYGYLEKRFGPASRFTGSAFFLISKVLGCGVRMYLTAVVLQLVLFGPMGIPLWLNALVTMAIVWLYSFRGGVKTLVWVDMLQTFALVGATVLCIWGIAKAMDLDLKGVCATVADSPMSRIWFFDDMMDKRNFFKQFFAGMFTTIAMTGLDQDMMQKNLSCRNLKESQKNVLSCGISFFPVNFLFLCLGVLLYSFAASVGLCSPDGALANGLKPDELFPALATGTNPATGLSYLPPIVGILFVLGLVAAAFSSAGSALTALTTSFTIDMLKADRKKDENGLKKTRIIVHLCNAVLMWGVICAFQVMGDGSVINAVYMLASYSYGPLLGLFCFGMFTRRNVRDGWMPVVCVASPLICLLLSTFSDVLLGGYKFGFELLLVNGLFTFIGALLCSKKA